MRRADIWLWGNRNFPERKITLTAAFVQDLPDLLAACQRLQPALDMDTLVRAIWRLASAPSGTIWKEVSASGSQVLSTRGESSPQIVT